MADRHAEKPLSLRLGAERQRLEEYAERTGMPVRRVIMDAVREKLDREEGASNGTQDQ
jgi:hypothetical protein